MPALVVIAASLPFAPSALAAAEPGQIAGTVTNTATQEAVAGLEVCAIAVSNGEARCGTTDSSGEYDVIGLPSGGYRVEFGMEYTHRFNYVPQFYDDKGSSSEAQTVSVLEGSVTSGIDAQMREGGRIAGTVSVPGGGLDYSIGDVDVCAFTLTGESSGCGNPKLDGEYTISELASGEYQLGFSPDGLDYFFLRQSASVTARQVTSGVDAALTEGGRMTGRVTDASTGEAIEGVEACAREVGEDGSQCGSTNANGEYTILRLNGEYRIEFSARSGDYLAEFYGDRSSFAQPEASPVSVMAPDTTSGIDMALQPGRFTAPANTAPPAMSGTAAVGSTLSCSPGSWTGNPAPTFTYGWLRDGTWIPGARESSYTAQATDKGHSLSCEVYATNVAGNTIGTEHAVSAGVIVAASVVNETPPGGTITSSPSPATALSAGLTDSTPLVTLTASKLMISGGSAPVDVQCQVTACQGSIELAVQVVTEGGESKTAASHKVTLVLATGSFSLAEGKDGSVLLHLTAAGRKRLAHARHHPITVRLILSVRGGKTTTKSVLAS